MRIIQRAYTVELDLKTAQATPCKRLAGVARWAYTWGLQRRQEGYRTTEKNPSAMDLHRELNALKQTAVPWRDEVSKCAPQEALRTPDCTFEGFLRRVQAEKAGNHRGKLGSPRRKSGKKGLCGFRLIGSIGEYCDIAQLPRVGRSCLKEQGSPPRSSVKVLSATISEQAGPGYVSVLVEHEQAVPPNTGPVVGVDLGVTRLATLSDRETAAKPRRLKRRLRKITRLHHAVSRKQQGSQNQKTAARKRGVTYRAVAHLRAPTVHHLTARSAKTKLVVVIEDLNVAAMQRNHHLAQAIAEGGFAVFWRQWEYNATWYGGRVIVADRWFASSKTCCSRCAWVDQYWTLADRAFRCQACGLVPDRVLNAARNGAILASSSADRHNTCGRGSAGLGCRAQLKLSSTKQEPNTFYSLVEYNGK